MWRTLALREGAVGNSKGENLEPWILGVAHGPLGVCQSDGVLLVAWITEIHQGCFQKTTISGGSGEMNSLSSTLLKIHKGILMSSTWQVGPDMTCHTD